jgi:hypothetical protein
MRKLFKGRTFYVLVILGLLFSATDCFGRAGYLDFANRGSTIVLGADNGTTSISRLKMQKRAKVKGWSQESVVAAESANYLATGWTAEGYGDGDTIYQGSKAPRHLVSSNSNAVNYWAPHVRTTSNAVNYEWPYLRTTSNWVNYWNQSVRTTSNAVNYELP